MTPLPPLDSPEWAAIRDKFLIDQEAREAAAVTRLPPPSPFRAGDRFVVSVQSAYWGRVVTIVNPNAPYPNTAMEQSGGWLVTGHLDGDPIERWKYWRLRDVERLIGPDEPKS